MWVSIVKTFVYCTLVMTIKFMPIHCHVPMSASTPATKIDQFCALSDACYHDTIPVCGMMDSEKRTFLDLCDMFEHICDTNQLFVHIDDEKDCPPGKED